MFEEKTYDQILNDLLGYGDDRGVDTSQGEVFWDSVSGMAFQIARLYTDLDSIFEMIFLPTAIGEYLDERGKEFAVTRNPATPARYLFIYEGTQPAFGERFFTEGRYFRLVSSHNVLCLEAEDTGTINNNIAAGTPAIPLNNIQGLLSSKFGALDEAGVDVESDDSYRKRIQEKISGPAENGNIQHYKTWCEENPSVGRATILPLWDGANTVKAILFDTEGLPSLPSVVEEVQEYIDPGGTGLGEGRANIGAHFTADSAETFEVSVSFSAQPASGFSFIQVKTEAETAIKSYFKEIVLDTPENETKSIRMSRLNSIIYSLSSVSDYTDLMINGQTQPVDVPKICAPVLKEAAVNAMV